MQAWIISFGRMLHMELLRVHPFPLYIDQRQTLSIHHVPAVSEFGSWISYVGLSAEE